MGRNYPGEWDYDRGKLPRGIGFDHTHVFNWIFSIHPWIFCIHLCAISARFCSHIAQYFRTSVLLFDVLYPPIIFLQERISSYTAMISHTYPALGKVYISYVMRHLYPFSFCSGQWHGGGRGAGRSGGPPLLHQLPIHTHGPIYADTHFYPDCCSVYCHWFCPCCPH